MAFDTAKETIFEARTGDALTKMTVEQQATLSPLPNGVKVTATGIDPILLLPPFIEGKQAIVQVAIESPEETVIQLFYVLQENPVQCEAQSQTVTLRAGSNVVYFQLDQPALLDPVRLDPGSAPGDYVIESIVARAITNLPPR